MKDGAWAPVGPYGGDPDLDLELVGYLVGNQGVRAPREGPNTVTETLMQML